MGKQRRYMVLKTGAKIKDGNTWVRVAGGTFIMEGGSIIVGCQDQMY